jgi:hypothetical protein
MRAVHAPSGLCECCWRIFRDGQWGETPARYAWTGQNGYTIRLCVRCCALWRGNAVEDPELEPLRIRELQAA